MKYKLLIFFILMSLMSFAQNDDEYRLAKEVAIMQFREQAALDTPDFSIPKKAFMKMLKEFPEDTEVLYFLGYIEDRTAYTDGKMMPQASLAVTKKISGYFEEVLSIDSLYTGDIFLLDPYSKITSTWGTLAMAYLNSGKKDSAVYAFKQGRNRGGFTTPLLSFAKQMLRDCNANAILVSYGDNLSFPLWYLQSVDKFRTDVTVVDINLLAAAWYGKFLLRNGLDINLSAEEIDSLNYKVWDTTNIVVRKGDKQFVWSLPPTYQAGYLLRNDLLLLVIVKQNLFARDIYFSLFSDSSYNLFLTPYLQNQGLLDRLAPDENYQPNAYVAIPFLDNYDIENVVEKDIANSPDAVKLLNYYRAAFYQTIAALPESDTKTIRKLKNQLYSFFNDKKLPYVNEEQEKFYQKLLFEKSKTIEEK